MHRALDNAYRALRVYFRRGQEVLAAIAAGDVTLVEESLRLRGAAFHNFRVQDVSATDAGFDITEMADARQVVAQIQVQNQKIVEAYSGFSRMVRRELAEIGRKKQQASRYRSRAKTISQFSKSV